MIKFSFLENGSNYCQFVNNLMHIFFIKREIRKLRNFGEENFR